MKKKDYCVSVQLVNGKEYIRYFDSFNQALSYYRRFKRGYNGKWFVYTVTGYTIESSY